MSRRRIYCILQMKRYYSVQKERNILHTVNEEILQCQEERNILHTVNEEILQCHEERNILHTVNEEILQCPEGEEYTAYCK